ncbi:heavy-metal-associated domain-containing protein [Halomicroarcula sp. GCM10025710]
MSCANCSQTVAEALESLDGVSAASINYATDEEASSTTRSASRSASCSRPSRTPATRR